MEEQLSEDILKEWLTVSSVVRNARIVKGMTFNEALICNQLWYQRHQDPDWLIPTELCRRTGMQKSLMNRTLKKLFERGLIEYVEIEGNRRSKPLRLKADQHDVFLKIHNQNLKVVDAIVDHLGQKKAEKVLEALKEISGCAEIISKASKN